MIVSALLLAAAVSAAPAVQVRPDVLLVPGGFVRGQQPDGNTIVFRAARGLVVFDTGRHESHTQKIVDLARQLGAPVAAIVNSHWHLDHIGGNALLRHDYPGLRVYASSALQDARKGFLERYRGQLQAMVEKTSDPEQKRSLTTELRLVESAGALAPDVVIGKTERLDLAGRNFDVHLENHAVTAADVWLYDPQSRVLVSGDLVTLPVPFLDTACPAGWSAALDDLARVDFAVLIPGHGAPMSRPDFEIYRTAYRNLVACGASSATKQACIAGWMNDAAPLLNNDDPAFVRSLLDYYVDVLRSDPARIREQCGGHR